MRLNALFRLAFASAPSFADLTSPHASNSSAHSSKGTPSGYRQAEAEPATPSDCLWARGFRYCFTPLIGVLFTFPSRNSFTFAYGAITLSGVPFQASSTSDRVFDSAGALPSPNDLLLQPQLRNG